MQKLKKLFRKLLTFNFQLSTRSLAKREKGFTLLELLIVIAILATLATIVVLVLNPAETLAKSRDTQRMSDLVTLKTAIALYTTTVSGPDLDASITDHCLAGTPNTVALISYSAEVANATCTAVVAPGGDVTTGSTFSTADFCRTVTSGASLTDGTGWVPVNLSDVVGGSPISSMPLDPVNDDPTSNPGITKKVYRYACQASSDTAGDPSNVFELNAVLESTEFNNKMTKDGGDNAYYYEVGTSTKLMGTGTNY